MKSHVFAFLAAAAFATATPIVHAQTWDYQIYDRSGRMTAPGYITLSDKGGGEYTIKMFASNLDQCWKSPLKATVEKSDETLTIETIPPYLGCYPVRFVIRNDGSGGERQDKKADVWVSDGKSRGLTLKQ